MSEGQQPPVFPSLVGCLRLGPAALAGVLRSPLVLGLVSLCFLLLATATVLGPYGFLSAELAQHPLANTRFGHVLLEDLARIHPDSGVVLGAAVPTAMLLMTFFAGGVLACVGVRASRRLRVSDFLAESGRHAFRSFRTLCVFAVLLMLWSFGCLGFAAKELGDLLIGGGAETKRFWFEQGVGLVYFLGFALLVLARRLALAAIVHEGRRSALLAYVGALRLLVRRPVACGIASLSLGVLWAGGLCVAAIALERYLGATPRLTIAFLIGCAALVFYQACSIASYVLARSLWVLDLADRAGVVEPVVVVAPATRAEASQRRSTPVATETRTES